MAHLDELVDSLLWEGYALYPYTPSTTKNSTPTPFGIVYPPAYAEGNPATHDHLRVEIGLVAEAEAEVSATVRFLQSSGERHEAVERRLELRAPGEAEPFEFDGLRGRARLRVDAAGDGEWRVRVCVHNETELDDAAGADRARALRASLLSTHVVVRAPGSRFVSATERPDLQSVNTWPVLATPEEDTVVGAAIVLPDHPQVAQRSRGGLFDSTEIEEALLLHVHALSDGERDAIAADDPAVRAMVERAAASTPQDIFDLHGVMRPSDEIARNGERAPRQPEPPLPSGEVAAAIGTERSPEQRVPPKPSEVSEAMFPPELRTPPDPDAPVRSRDQNEPPIPPSALPKLTGEQEVTIAAGTFHKGGKVRLRPRRGGSDPFDVAAAGRVATIERLLYDVDDRLQFAVTLDDDPGQELLRDTGRFLYYFEGEVEPV